MEGVREGAWRKDLEVRKNEVGSRERKEECVGQGKCDQRNVHTYIHTYIHIYEHKYRYIHPYLFASPQTDKQA